MEHHSSHQAPTHSENQKFNPRVELPPRLRGLEAIARRMYKGLPDEADQSDLEQFVETQAAARWERAAELLTGAVLMATATNEIKVTIH